MKEVGDGTRGHSVTVSGVCSLSSTWAASLVNTPAVFSLPATVWGKDVGHQYSIIASVQMSAEDEPLVRQDPKPCF